MHRVGNEPSLLRHGIFLVVIKLIQKIVARRQPTGSPRELPDFLDDLDPAFLMFARYQRQQLHRFFFMLMELEVTIIGGDGHFAAACLCTSWARSLAL